MRINRYFNFSTKPSFFIANCNHDNRYQAMRQKGISFLLSLLMLLVLSIATITAIQTGALQERIAGNSRDRNTAFNAAESALRDAEAYLSNTENLPLFNGSKNGLYQINSINGLRVAGGDPSNTAFWQSKTAIDFLQSKGITYGSLTGATALPSSDVKAQPRYIIEMMPNNSERAITYRITSMGTARDNSVVVLQSYYTPPQYTVIN